MKYTFLHYIRFTGLCNINIITVKTKNSGTTISYTWHCDFYSSFTCSEFLLSGLEINTSIITLEWEKRHNQFLTKTLGSLYFIFFLLQNQSESSLFQSLHFYYCMFHFTCHLWAVYLTNQSKLVFLDWTIFSNHRLYFSFKSHIMELAIDSKFLKWQMLALEMVPNLQMRK